MPYINTKENINLYFDMIGDGPQTLLFIHGWAAERRVWFHQIKHFQDYCRIITLDLPGHGKSSWEEVTLDGIVEDVHFLLNTLGIEHVNIIGSSLGGLVSIKYTGRFPRKVRRLALVGSMPRFYRDDHFPCGLTYSQIEGLKKQVETEYPKILAIFFRSLFTMKERNSVRFKWLRTFQKNQDLPDPNALIRFLEMLQEEDLIDVFEQIRIPIFLSGGANDYICPRETIEYMKSKCQNVHVVLFDNCGHFPFLSKPKKFNYLLEEFINTDASDYG